MSSSFLVFDMIRRNAGLKREGNARRFIHPKVDDGEEAFVRTELVLTATAFFSRPPVKLWGWSARPPLDIQAAGLTRLNKAPWKGQWIDIICPYLIPPSI
jgi:hypothetical protein